MRPSIYMEFAGICWYLGDLLVTLAFAEPERPMFDLSVSLCQVPTEAIEFVLPLVFACDVSWPPRFCKEKRLEMSKVFDIMDGADGNGAGRVSCGFCVYEARWAC